MKRFYIIITCQILALISFLSSHFLLSIYYYSKYFFVYFFMDLAIFLAIGLQIVAILLFISLEVNDKK